MVASGITSPQLACFHDAELYNVHMDRTTSSVRLSFAKVDSTRGEFCFQGVVEYRIESIHFQNVASRLRLLSSSEPSDLAIEKILKWTFSRLPENLSSVSSERLSELHSKIVTGDLVLFYLEPSVGAELGVVAETVSLTNIV